MSRRADLIEANPYAPPGEGGGEAPTNVYTLSLRGLTARDLRKLSTNRVGFLLLWLIRVLRVQLAPTAVTPQFEQLKEVFYDAIPEANREAIQNLEETCRAAGLTRHCCYQSPLIAPGPLDYGVIYASTDGRMTVNLFSQWQRTPKPVAVVASIVASTQLKSKGRLISSNHPWWAIDPPSGTERRHNSSWSAEQLLEEHRRWISERDEEIVPIDPARLLEVQSTREREFVQSMIDRGILVPMRERELHRFLRQVEEASASAPVESSRVRRIKFYEVLAFIVMIGMFFVFAVSQGDARLVGLIGCGYAMAVWIVLIVGHYFVDRSEKTRTRA